MRHHTHGRGGVQLARARRELLAEPQLCLGKLLAREHVAEALVRHAVVFRERLYTPVVTLWLFLCQVLAADQSCRAAVSRLLAFVTLAAGGQCSFQTGAYCKARGRLPEALLSDLARQSARALHQRVAPSQLLGGRPIKIADGTTVSMPDAAANQKAYPQPSSQKPQLGFPLMRLVGLMCLSCGALLDVAMGPYSGKKTGEGALLRQLLGGLQPGDVLLADAYFANYWMVADLLARGVDLVAHHDGKRRVNFQTGRRLGRGDHVVQWTRPPRPAWMTKRQYRRMPPTLRIREVKVAVPQRGFRTKQLLLITTLCDAQEYSKTDLAAAYRARWHAELDLRTIKQVMQMEVLRCKTPAMVRKEVWMHMLAYNLVRTLMAEAATLARIQPRQISFTGTLQALVAFAAAGWTSPSQDTNAIYQAILRAVAVHRVGNRPDRVEPRAVKRRPKTLAFLTEPRSLARQRLLEGD